MEMKKERADRWAWLQLPTLRGERDVQSRIPTPRTSPNFAFARTMADGQLDSWPDGKVMRHKGMSRRSNANAYFFLDPDPPASRLSLLRFFETRMGWP